MENTAAVSGDAGIYEEYPGERGSWTSVDMDVFKWFGFLGEGCRDHLYSVSSPTI